MLLGEGERPRASGMQPAAAQATNGLVIDLRHAAAQLWASSADAIKAACGPHMPSGLVDEYDVLAWLTADALGRPLLHPDDTNRVGKRIAAQAARVEKKLQAEAESMRKAVGKARAAVAEKPELLPKVAAAKATGEKVRAVLLEKPYDAQLPATTVGEKRSESHWRQREVKEIRAKSAKLTAAATAAAAAATKAEAALDAANARYWPLQDRIFEGDRKQKDYTALEAARKRCDVASIKYVAARAAADEAEDAAEAAAEAAEAIDAESEGEDEVYANACAAAEAAKDEAMAAEASWMAAEAEAVAARRAAVEAQDAADVANAVVSESEEEYEYNPSLAGYDIWKLITTMVRAVSMHAAGFAECAGCALLALRRADHLAVYEGEDELNKYCSYGLYSSELHEWLEQSRPFEDCRHITHVEGRHIAAASGLGPPSDCAKRCARCAGSTDSWLTVSGKQELAKAFLAGERARLIIREQQILALQKDIGSLG